MALDLTKMQTTFTNLVAQAPVSCVFDGNDFAATKTELTVQRRINEFGGADEYGFSLVVNADALVTFPVSQEIVTVAGTEFRVMTVKTLPLGISKRIDFEAKYQ